MTKKDSNGLLADALTRLLENDIAQDDRTFWSGLFSEDISFEDVLDAIEPDEIQQLRETRPRNLQGLLRGIVDAMLSVCASADEGKSLTPAMVTVANTSIRILTRIMPLLLREQDEAVVHDILWKPGGFIAETLAEPTPSEPPSSSLPDDICAHSIMHLIGRFLFLSDYTVTPQRKPSEKGDDIGKSVLPTSRVERSVVWKGGVGTPEDLATVSSEKYNLARTEVLRCLLACVSGPLYRSADENQKHPSPWLLRFTGGQVCYTANLFGSLMSIVCTYDPVGWGIPYGSFFSSGTEEALVDVALQVLCVLIDFDSREGKADATATVVAKETTVVAKEMTAEPEDRTNVFRFMLSNITREADIELIYDGIVRLLSTPYQANKMTLPKSFRAVEFYQEALVLFWHLMTVNPCFVKRVVDDLNTNEIVLPVLYLFQVAQSSEQLVGLLHAASFVLLVLSSERSFSVRLNEPYHGGVPFKIPSFNGCHADVVTLVLHNVISDFLAKPQYEALVEILTTVLCNISPYIKSFSLESSLKLCSLIERCSKPAYLFRSAFAHRSLTFLLELLNNVVQYQYGGNAILVCAVLRQKNIFMQLTNLGLQSSEVVDTATMPPTDPKDQGTGEEERQDTEPTTIESTTAPVLACDAEQAGEEKEHKEIEDESDTWKPTEGWLMSWKDEMPLQTLLHLVDHLGPQVNDFIEENEILDQKEVVTFVQSLTMVGVLPVPHPIVTRTYEASSKTTMWFSSYLWGVILMRSPRPVLHDIKKIRIVNVSQ